MSAGGRESGKRASAEASDKRLASDASDASASVEPPRLDTARDPTAGAADDAHACTGAAAVSHAGASSATPAGGGAGGGPPASGSASLGSERIEALRSVAEPCRGALRSLVERLVSVPLSPLRTSSSAADKLCWERMSAMAQLASALLDPLAMPCWNEPLGVEQQARRSLRLRLTQTNLLPSSPSLSLTPTPTRTQAGVAVLLADQQQHHALSLTPTPLASLLNALWSTATHREHTHLRLSLTLTLTSTLTFNLTSTLTSRSPPPSPSAPPSPLLSASASASPSHRSTHIYREHACKVVSREHAAAEPAASSASSASSSLSTSLNTSRATRSPPPPPEASTSEPSGATEMGEASADLGRSRTASYDPSEPPLHPASDTAMGEPAASAASPAEGSSRKGAPGELAGAAATVEASSTLGRSRTASADTTASSEIGDLAADLGRSRATSRRPSNEPNEPSSEAGGAPPSLMPPVPPPPPPVLVDEGEGVGVALLSRLLDAAPSPDHERLRSAASSSTAHARPPSRAEQPPTSSILAAWASADRQLAEAIRGAELKTAAIASVRETSNANPELEPSSAQDRPHRVGQRPPHCAGLPPQAPPKAKLAPNPQPERDPHADRVRSQVLAHPLAHYYFRQFVTNRVLLGPCAASSNSTAPSIDAPPPTTKATHRRSSSYSGPMSVSRLTERLAADVSSAFGSHAAPERAPAASRCECTLTLTQAQAQALARARAQAQA